MPNRWPDRKYCCQGDATAGAATRPSCTAALNVAAERRGGHASEADVEVAQGHCGLQSIKAFPGNNELIADDHGEIPALVTPVHQVAVELLADENLRVIHFRWVMRAFRRRCLRNGAARGQALEDEVLEVGVLEAPSGLTPEFDRLEGRR